MAMHKHNTDRKRSHFISPIYLLENESGMAGSAKRGTGIFEDCNRGGQEFDRRLYRIAMYDLQRHKGRPL